MTSTEPERMQLRSFTHFGVLLRVHQIGPDTFTPPTKGVVVKKANGTLHVRAPYKRIQELNPSTKISYHLDDEDLCTKHPEPVRRRVRLDGGSYCLACAKDREKLARSDAGQTPEQAAELAAGKLAKAHQANAAKAAAKELQTLEANVTKAMKDALTTYERLARIGVGADYRRSLLTDVTEHWNVTVERAAALAGVQEWEPLTWTEYRAAQELA